MKKRTISIDPDVLAELGRAVRRFRHEGGEGLIPPIFAHDPGSGSSHQTGWCLIASDGTTLAGEGHPHDVVDEAAAAIDVVGAVRIYVREDAFTGSRAQMAEERENQITPRTLYRMGLAAGIVTGGIDGGARRRLTSAVLWSPLPNTWRAVLGLNRRGDGILSAREATADAIWEWARATTGLPLMKGKHRMIDCANAVGMAFAALDIAQQAERLAS